MNSRWTLNPTSTPWRGARLELGVVSRYTGSASQSPPASKSALKVDFLEVRQRQQLAPCRRSGNQEGPREWTNRSIISLRPFFWCEDLQDRRPLITPFYKQISYGL